MGISITILRGLPIYGNLQTPFQTPSKTIVKPSSHPSRPSPILYNPIVICSRSPVTHAIFNSEINEIAYVCLQLVKYE